MRELFNRLNTDNDLLEITALDLDTAIFHTSEKNYFDYNSLPDRIKNSITAIMDEFQSELNQIESYGYSGNKAYEKLLWCLFGSYDDEPDINLRTGEFHVEYPAHCNKCQFDNPFCIRRIGSLTERETAVGILIKSGLIDKEIAEIEGKSIKTIKNQRRYIEAKIRLIIDAPANTASITQYIIKHGG